MSNHAYLHDVERESRFALQRVILIDSYSKGRIAELPIAGGTAIVSANGRGKTSLLQLIPAFFGERPDRIVKPVSNRDNFARYYLPRSTSYIVFEYQRDDALCCAVLCADPSGEGVEYRFVRSGYEQTWFVHDDKITLVSSANLTERLKQLGAYYSRKMPLDQYRAIIQGKRAHGSDLKQHRRNILDYAYCPSSHSLHHIERIVFGMYMRKSNFTDLQRMIVSTITDTSSNIMLGAERKKIEAWPDAFNSYTAVMAEEPRMEVIQVAYDELLAAEHELRTIHGRFHTLDLVLEDEECEKNKLLVTAKDEQTSTEEKHSDARRDIMEKIQSTNNTIEHHRYKLKTLGEQHAGYQSKNIEVLAALLDREGEFSQSLQQLESRKKALLAQLSNIDDEYQKILDTLNLNHKDRLIEFGHQQLQVKSAHQQQIAAIQAESKTQEDETRKASSVAEVALQLALDLANEAFGSAKGQLDNPQPDATVAAIAEQQEVNVDAARDKHQAAIEDEEAAKIAYKKASHDFDREELALRELRDEVQKSERKLEALLRQATPDENSLLYFLRQERADWPQDIAKVLREDLLSRTDLAPVIGVLQDSVYGLQLDLVALETPLAADESALQCEIEEVRDGLRKLNISIAEQEASLAQRGRDRLTFEDLKNKKSLLTAMARAALNSGEQLLHTARNNVRCSRESAKVRAQEAYIEATHVVEAAKKDLSTHRAQLEKEINSIRERQEKRQNESLANLECLLNDITNNEMDAVSQYNDAREQIAKERMAKLQASGVDTEALATLEQKITDTSTKLCEIDKSRTLVAEWHLWLNAEWSQKGKHDDALDKALKEKGIHETKKGAITKAWHDDSSRCKQAINSLTQQLDSIRATRTQITQHRKALEHYPANMDTLPEYNAAWQIVSLVEQSNTQFRALNQHENMLQQEITALKRVFTISRHSPSDQYYETQRQIIGPDRADKPREWVPVFKAWYMSEHLQCRNLLRVDARTIADAVGDFRDRIDIFHRKVQQFNRELQDNINSNQGFKSIGGLTVEIVSSIRELEYWGIVDKVAESRLEWLAGSTLDLPPPEFTIALRELLGHWQLKEGIQAELTNLVRVQGEVIENGNRRPFKKAEDLEHISSNGLSYIVLVLLFLAFINRVRGTAPVNIVWALDEIGSLDTGNTVVLVDILKRNNVTLVTACPDPKPDVLTAFRNRRSISSDRRIYDPKVTTATKLVIKPDAMEAVHV